MGDNRERAIYRDARLLIIALEHGFADANSWKRRDRAVISLARSKGALVDDYPGIGSLQTPSY